MQTSVDRRSVASVGQPHPGTELLCQIIRWMQANPAVSREVALHAGQCLRIIRESPFESTVEMFSLFFAALVLYVFCIAIQEEAFGIVDSDASDNISLDCPSPSCAS